MAHGSRTFLFPETMQDPDEAEITEQNQNAREAVEIILRELKRQQADPAFGAGVDEEWLDA